jgi:hypothetical protein
MRHHGGADNADRKQKRFAVGKLRRNGVEESRAPIDRRDRRADLCLLSPRDIHRADDEFERAEA